MITPEENSKIHSMLKKLSPIVFSEEPHIGISAMLSMIMNLFIHSKIPREEIVEEIMSSYDHYKGQYEKRESKNT